MPSFLEESTRISAKTWRKDGGPKRESTVVTARSRMHDWVLDKLQNEGGYTQDEARKICERRFSLFDEPASLSHLVLLFEGVERKWPRTEVLAGKIDKAALNLQALREANDLPGFRNLIFSEMENAPENQWRHVAGEYARVRDKTLSAEEWPDLDELVRLWCVKNLYQFLACWDAEFLSVYLTDKNSTWGMEPQPVFLLVTPALNPSAKMNEDGRYSARNLWRLPLRRLLEFCYLLAHVHREGTWPKKGRVRRTDVAAWGGILLQRRTHRAAHSQDLQGGARV